MQSRAVEDIQPGLMQQAQRFFLLTQIDNIWKEHLQAMQFLRQAVGLRGGALSSFFCFLVFSPCGNCYIHRMGARHARRAVLFDILFLQDEPAHDKQLAVASLSLPPLPMSEQPSVAGLHKSMSISQQQGTAASDTATSFSIA
jgi:hypothetical protein